MIDRETAIQKLEECGIKLLKLAVDGKGTLGEGCAIASISEIQTLITRAFDHGRAEQSEAIATMELENRMMRERNEQLEAEIKKMELKHEPT